MIDVANGNGQQDDDPGSDTANHWALHRVHQFEVNLDGVSYGGVSVGQIDEDFFNLGQICGPAVASGASVIRPRDAASCSRLAAAG